MVYCQVLGEAERGATNVSLPKIGLVTITFDMTIMTHVTRLSLRHNCLGLLPNEIASMKMLVELHLQHNRLTQLPNVMVGLTNLRILDLSHNEIMRIPTL
jgi:Leucine-rich repeat (LRR) protein